MANFEWYGDYYEKAIENNVQKELLTAAADLQRKSSEQAPVDKGDLRGNCAVDSSKVNNLQVSVGYNLPYAWIQHEDMSFNHPKGGKAKYLEDPFNANKERYRQEIANAVAEATKL